MGALAVVLAGAAERNALIQRAVIADHGRFADHDAHAVVDEQIFPDCRPGMDLNARAPAGALGDHAGNKLHIAAVKPVRPAVGAHRLKAGIEEIHLCPAARGGVALHHGVQLRFQLRKQTIISLKAKSPERTKALGGENTHMRIKSAVPLRFIT